MVRVEAGAGSLQHGSPDLESFWLLCVRYPFRPIPGLLVPSSVNLMGIALNQVTLGAAQPP